MARIFGYELTEGQGQIVAAKEDLVRYARELVGQKREHVGPGVVAIPEEVREELLILLEKIDKAES